MDTRIQAFKRKISALKVGSWENVKIAFNIIDNKISNYLFKYTNDERIIMLMKIIIYLDILVIFFFSVLNYIILNGNCLFLLGIIFWFHSIAPDMTAIGFMMDYKSIILKMLIMKSILTIFLFKVYFTRAGVLFKFITVCIGGVELDVPLLICPEILGAFTAMTRKTVENTKELEEVTKLAAAKPGQIAHDPKTGGVAVCAKTKPMLMDFLRKLCGEGSIAVENKDLNRGLNHSWHPVYGPLYKMINRASSEYVVPVDDKSCIVGQFKKE